MVAQERKYAARVGPRLCRAMRARLQAYTYYYAIFNYCVGASGVPASVLNIVGDQPLYTDLNMLFYMLHSQYYRSITIVQSDTGKYHELVAPYYYECAARVIIP